MANMNRYFKESRELWWCAQKLAATKVNGSIRAKKLYVYIYALYIFLSIFIKVIKPVFFVHHATHERTPKIVFLCPNEFFQHYFIPIVHHDSRFVFRRSRWLNYGVHGVPEFDPADKNTRRVVLSSDVNYVAEGFNKTHRLILRNQHSPGFGLPVLIVPFYRRSKAIGARLMIPKFQWDLILKSDYLGPDATKVREEIIRDGTPLLFTHYDLKLHTIYNYPITNERESGTVLVSFNHTIRHELEDVELLIRAVDYLRLNGRFKIVVKFHQIITEEDFFIGQPLNIFKNYVDRFGITIIFGITTFHDLISLYDRHEFILTDGSGTVYEAIARGCKALTLNGLCYHQENRFFYPAVKMGLLPTVLVWDYKSHPGAKHDMDWLFKLYSHSLIKQDIAPLVAKEIVDAFSDEDHFFD